MCFFIFFFFFSLYIDLKSNALCEICHNAFWPVSPVFFFSAKRNWLFVKQKVYVYKCGQWVVGSMVVVNGANNKQLVI